MLEDDACEALCRMRLIDPEQVVHAPHALGKLGRREDPAAAQAAEAIDLRKAVGDDELRSQMNRAWTGRNGRVEIDLIDQDPGSNLGCKVAKRSQFRFLGKGAAWVVQVGDHDQARFWA